MTPHNEWEPEKRNQWMVEFEEKFCTEYGDLSTGILKNELKMFIYRHIVQTRQETVREVIEKIDENYTIMREAQSAGVEWQLVALSLLRDDVVALGEEYGIKDE